MIIKKNGYTVKIINRNLAVIIGGKLGNRWQKVGRLLGKGDQNTKTKKNLVKTYGLSLYPEKGIGFGNLCPHAKTCQASCLAHQGQGDISHVKRARIAKTVLWYLARDWFLSKLNRELYFARKRNRDTVGIRLNMFSDISWEAYDIIEKHPGLTFYDYSKSPKRHGWIRDNYHVTFSYDGQNLESALNVLQSGDNVSVVFFDRSEGAKCGKAAHRQILPSYWQGFPVIDGGLTDWRPEDPSPCIVGLRLLSKTWKSRDFAISSGFAIENIDNQLVNDDSLEYWMIGGEA